MSYLAPAALWALPLAALPALIHLLSRARRKFLEFPAVEELADVVESNARASRLREKLLLLLRTALIAAVVLLAARPYRGSEAGRRLAIIALDTSASMTHREATGRSSWEKAIAAADALLRRTDRRQPVALLAFDSTGARRVGLPSEEPEPPLASLRRLEPLPRPGLPRPLSALRKAAADWGAEAGAQAIDLVVISDFRGETWRTPPPAHDAHPANQIRVIALPVARRDGANRGITALRAARIGPERVQVDYAVRQWGAGHPIELNIELEGELIRRLELPADTTNSGRLEIETPSGGHLRASIEADGLALDDQRHAYIAPWRPLSIWVAGEGGDDTSDAWAARILDPEEVGPLSRIPPSELAPERWVEPPDLLVLADVESLPREVVDEIALRVRGGAGLLTILGPRTDLRAFHSSGLAMLCGAEAVDLLDGDAPLLVERLDPSHPILAIFSPEELDALEQVPIRRALSIAVDPGSSARTLIGLAGGGPLLTTRDVGRGRVALLATALDMNWGEWPAHAPVVALLHQCALHLSGRAAAAESVDLGAPLASPLGPPGVTEALLHFPDGDSARVAAGGVRLPPDLLRNPGPHHWWIGVERADFAANVSARVGDLGWTDPASLHTVEGHAAIQLLRPDQARTEGLRPPGLALEPFLVALLALLLLSEAWIRRPGR